MDRAQLLLVGLPLFLFCSDIFHLFTPPPPHPPHHHHHHHHPHHHPHHPHPHPHPHPHHPHPHPPHHHPDSHTVFQQQKPSIEFPNQKADGIGFRNTISIDFCSSCSYRGTATTMKNMLESQFPGVSVVLANYPPPLPKRVLSKLVPIVQFGVIGIIVGGEQIFPRLGFAAPPQWFYSLRANRFGSMASTWLLGNFLQSFLHSSGAFEVYCNGELVFSKLKENRFPGEIELKDLVGRKISSAGVVDGLHGGY